jgi:hypothetical protein
MRDIGQMRCRPKTAGACFLILGLVLLVTSACQSPPQEADKSPAPSGAIRGFSGPTHDLSQDEASGGHTLSKHVSRSDEQLRQRLDRERRISAASTYTDREAAERVVGMVLQQNQAKIRRWLEPEGGHPNLVLDYDGDAAHPIGRTLRRGDEQTAPCSHALVVLKWSGPTEYYVLTSYPECR